MKNEIARQSAHDLTNFYFFGASSLTLKISTESSVTRSWKQTDCVMKTTANEAPATDPSSRVYKNLFAPGTIAVIGASNDPMKPGGRVIKNIKDHDFGGRLWAVNPKSGSILELPTYRSIDALPEAPDLAIVAIPAKFVLPAVQELADRGTGATIVLTSGFGEKDAAGRQAEQEMKGLEI